MAKKIKINTNYHYSYDNSRHEINSGEVMTIPDQSYTIEEIIDKFSRGINLELGNDAFYSDTDDFDEIDERSQILDLTDISEAEGRMAARRNKRNQASAGEKSKATELAEEQQIASPKDV